MYHFAICLYVIFSPLVRSLELHETLTRDDVIKIFQASSDTVLHYEITYPMHKKIHKRSVDKLFNISYDKEFIQLYLHPADEFLIGKHTKVWMGYPDQNSANGFQYQQIPNVIGDIEEFYLDDKNNAALHITTDEHGNTLLDGTIRDHLTIRPIPKEYLMETTTVEKFEPLVNYYQKIGRPHIVISRSKTIQKNKQKVAAKHIPKKKMTPIKSVKKMGRKDIVHPELLIFIDETLFAKLYRNIRYTVRYVMTSFYGVDLRYRALSNPAIRFRITGIIIVNGSITGMLPRITKKNANPFKFIRDFARYLPKINSQFEFTKHYDIAVFMTGLDMREENMFGNDTSTAPTLGIAFIEGACQIAIEEETKSEIIKSAAIVTDTGAYSGIHIATHELGHVLGSPEDPLKGSEECKWGDNGYIMSYFSATTNRIKFSPCSQKSISKYLKSGKAECLYNLPPKDEPISVPLPGKLMTMDEQCLASEGTNFCYERRNDPYICAKLHCINPDIEDRKNNNCSEIYFPPAEGTPCGDNKVCINAECVTFS